VEFVVDKVALGQVPPPPEDFGFPCRFHSTGTQLHGKNKKKLIFITGLHNKPQGCGATVASAAGPFTKKSRITQNLRDASPRYVACVNKNTPTGKMLKLAPIISNFEQEIFETVPLFEGNKPNSDRDTKVAKTKYGSGPLYILGNRPRA
jgi:hypothetical protein